jgi:hypothetical protein
MTVGPVSALPTEEGQSIETAATSRETMIATLRRSACEDQDLLAVAAPAEIAGAVERTVDTLWEQSRVKSFIGVLAMRDLRASLGNPVGAHPESGALRAVARRDGGFRLSGDDEPTLSDDGRLD